MIKQIEIRGRFLPILRWTVVLVIAVFAVGILVVWLTDDGTNRGVMRTADVIQLFIPIFGWIAVGAFGFSAFMYAISWYARVRINENEISGRTYGGFKVTFPSQSVTTVTATRYQGVQYLWISSDATSRQLCLVLLGVPINEHVGDLARILGPDHGITKWFRGATENK